MAREQAELGEVYDFKWRRNYNAAFKAKVSLKAVCSGFTITELAQSYRCISARWRIGKDWSIHRNYISQLELGCKSPSLRTIFKLCKVLKSSPAAMIEHVERRMDTLKKTCVTAVR